MKVGYSYSDFWSFLDSDDNLLREVLIFDNVIVAQRRTDLIEKMLLAFPEGKEIFSEKMRHFELLEKNALIEIIDEDKVEIPPSLRNDRKIQKLYVDSIKHYDKISGIGERHKKSPPIKIFSEFMELDRTGGELGSRYKSMLLSEQNKTNEYIPILRTWRKTGLSETDPTETKVGTSKSEVIQIVLNDFPYISGEIPLEKIVEFKNEKEIKSRYFEFRNFITDLNKQNLPTNEIFEKLEYLKNEYKDGLDLMNLKYDHSTFSMICITTSEIIENLCKLKFSKAVKALFEISKKEIEILEEERRLKGREVSYLYYINEKLLPIE